MEKLFEVAKKIDEAKIALDRTKAGIFKLEPSVTDILADAVKASDILEQIFYELEDIEMEQVDFDNINLDKHFEGDPISEYIQAGIAYAISGDESELERRKEAASRIDGTKVVTSEEGAADLLNRILDAEEEFAEQLEKSLEAIENVLEGTKIDSWTEDQVELARYFLQFQPDASVNEVDALTPNGVKIVWKRRRWTGAAK